METWLFPAWMQRKCDTYPQIDMTYSMKFWEVGQATSYSGGSIMQKPCSQVDSPMFCKVCKIRRPPKNGHFLIIYPLHSIPVVPGQAGGGSFQKEKNYIAKKEFAYRMCARRPTSAMPKSFLCLCSPSAVPWW